MNNENFHPVLTVPPLAHALHRWNARTKTLTYEYNGIDIIKIHLPESENPGFRHGSDGTVQSIQYTQQIYLTVEKPMWTTIEFNLSRDCMNMKPQRADREEAILGQSGNILISGVNGLYDAYQDLLLTINGQEWVWETREFEYRRLDELHCRKAELPESLALRKIARARVKLTQKPLFINLFMHYYRNHLGYCYYEPWKRKCKERQIAGWCSWEAFRRDIDIDKIKAISKFMEEKLKDYGLEYIQLDDGYQKMPLPYDPQKDMANGWLTCSESKFPGGHKKIVETIRNYHMIPAIWTNANITNEEFVDYHKDTVLCHKDRPLKGEWIDFLYNCKPETLEKQVKPIFQGYKQAGYEYIKIDAIRHLLMDGLHEAVRLGIMTNEEAEHRFRAYLEATREGMGDDIYYLASWGEMHEVIGVADACRIAMDANPTWAGIRMQLFEMARWFHTQRILFLNDPDHVCVRTKLDWAKSVLSLISLSGGLYMLSDTLDAYTEEKLQVIRKTLPPLKTRTAESGKLNMNFPAYTWTKLHGFAVQSHETPVEMEEITMQEVYDMAGVYPTMYDKHPFSTLWAFHINENGQTWCVMGRFATIPLEASEIAFTRLGLEEGKTYHAFDFWEEKYLGSYEGKLPCKELKVGQCQIVALRETKGVPQLIASSRHVSMDAVSVKKAEFDNNELKLELESVKEATNHYYIHVPKKYMLLEVQSEEKDISLEKQEEIAVISVTAHTDRTRLTLSFTDCIE